MKKSANEIINNSKTLFMGDLTKNELILTTCYNSLILLVELAEKEQIEPKILTSDGGILKLSAEIISTGKISVPIFKKILNFLYSSCKMSEKVAAYFKEKHADLIGKFLNSLLGHEFGSDIELFSVISGFIQSIYEDLSKLEKGMGQEIIKSLKKIIIETNIQSEYMSKIDSIIKTLDKAKMSAGGEEIPENSENASPELVQLKKESELLISQINACSISFEIFAELFTQEEINDISEEIDENEKIEENDVKMEDNEIAENYKENLGDENLDAALFSAILIKSQKILNAENIGHLKSLKSASEIIQVCDKMRLNATSCLINLSLNRHKKFIEFSKIISGTDTLILGLFKELFEPTDAPTKQSIVEERISTFVKIIFEKYDSELKISKFISETDIPKILEATKLQNENIQANIVYILGIILKNMQHSKDLNKVYFLGYFCIGNL